MRNSPAIVVLSIQRKPLIGKSQIHSRTFLEVSGIRHSAKPGIWTEPAEVHVDTVVSELTTVILMCSGNKHKPPLFLLEKKKWRTGTTQDFLFHISSKHMEGSLHLSNENGTSCKSEKWWKSRWQNDSVFFRVLGDKSWYGRQWPLRFCSRLVLSNNILPNSNTSLAPTKTLLACWPHTNMQTKCLNRHELSGCCCSAK